MVFLAVGVFAALLAIVLIVAMVRGPMGLEPEPPDGPPYDPPPPPPDDPDPDDDTIGTG